jgi:hypothetical protein
MDQLDDFSSHFDKLNDAIELMRKQMADHQTDIRRKFAHHEL